MKTLGLCSDHAGYELKEFVKQILDSKGLAYKDFGTDSTESCDYPDYAHPLAKAVEAGEVYPGIAICGSGNGTWEQANAFCAWRTDYLLN